MKPSPDSEPTATRNDSAPSRGPPRPQISSNDSLRRAKRSRKEDDQHDRHRTLDAETKEFLSELLNLGRLATVNQTLQVDWTVRGKHDVIVLCESYDHGCTTSGATWIRFRPESSPLIFDRLAHFFRANQINFPWCQFVDKSGFVLHIDLLDRDEHHRPREMVPVKRGARFLKDQGRSSPTLYHARTVIIGNRQKRESPASKGVTRDDWLLHAGERRKHCLYKLATKARK